MKIRKSKAILNSIARLLLLALLLLAAIAWRGQMFGIKTDGSSTETFDFELKINDCYDYFPAAASLQKINNQQYQIYNSDKKPIGNAFGYRGEQGYGGRIPLFVLTDINDVVKGIILGNHYESSDYFKDLINSGFLFHWNGIKRSKIISHEVDIASGATISSKAIISGVKSAMAGRKIAANYNVISIENLLSLLLLLLLTIAYLKPKWLIRYRTILQVFSIVIFGFWLTRLLSLGQILSWFSTGINWKAQLFIGVVFILSVLLPVFFGKAFYCSWVCPYGAAQELCGKVNSKKIRISPKNIKILNYTREGIFFIIMVIFWTGFVFDVSLVEPFAAFSITNTGYFTLGLAGFFLVISLFVPKAWCNYFCPTGYVLEWIRK